VDVDVDILKVKAKVNNEFCRPRIFLPAAVNTTVIKATHVLYQQRAGKKRIASALQPVSTVAIYASAWVRTFVSNFLTTSRTSSHNIFLAATPAPRSQYTRLDTMLVSC
jgi:hypothetical protein